MLNTSELRRFLQFLFPKAGTELLALYESATDLCGIRYTDLCTVHDLLDLSGYIDEEPLHALLIIMLAALQEGSVCVPTEETALAGRLAEFSDGERARNWAARISAGLKEHGYPQIVGTEGAIDRPVIRTGRSQGDLLYFQKLLKYEMDFVTVLQRRLETGQATPAAGFQTAIQQVLADNPPINKGHALRLNDGQQIGLALALLRNFVILSGGPGTGKTSIIFTLLRCLLRSGIAPDRIALAAPTGLAAQRLTDAIRRGFAGLPGLGNEAGPVASLKDIRAQTLHRLLQYQPSLGLFRHHAENPLPFDVVIVDEVSMIGLVLMAQLFAAVAPQTKLILLGDKDQLPSVEAGALLAHLAPADGRQRYSADTLARLAELLPAVKLPTSGAEHPLRDVLVMLDENFRSGKQIQEVAQAINRQDQTLLDRLSSFTLLRKVKVQDSTEPSGPSSFADVAEQGGCWLMETKPGSSTEWKRTLMQWAEHHYLFPQNNGESYLELIRRCQAVELEPSEELNRNLNQLFAYLGQARILTLIREGAWGCEGINDYLSRVLRPRFDSAGNSPLFAGAPVLVTRNDYHRELFNGDVGIALRTAEGGYRVYFQRCDEFLSFPIETLPAHELAFALTVHKSQGSEYGQVLLVLPHEGGRRLLTKELIYTGITRAKDLAILCGSKEVLAAALSRKTNRTSGLAYLS
ncbi:MAG: exodeoxyribonuclease V subunit alpha [Gemmataceae bacterium]